MTTTFILVQRMTSDVLYKLCYLLLPFFNKNVLKYFVISSKRNLTKKKKNAFPGTRRTKVLFSLSNSLRSHSKSLYLLLTVDSISLKLGRFPLTLIFSLAQHHSLWMFTSCKLPVSPQVWFCGLVICSPWCQPWSLTFFCSSHCCGLSLYPSVFTDASTVACRWDEGPAHSWWEANEPLGLTFTLPVKLLTMPLRLQPRYPREKQLPCQDSCSVITLNSK